MKYEIVNLEEKFVVGISARTNNNSADMSNIITGLWTSFFKDGIYQSIQNKVNHKTLGVYTEYENNENDDYTVMVGCEVSCESKELTCVKIPAGKYAKFIAKGDIHLAVAEVWQEVWKMNLNRSFVCDFEEYQNEDVKNAEIHIYIGLKK